MNRLFTVILASVLTLGAIAQTSTTEQPEFVGTVLNMKAPSFADRTLSIAQTGAKQGKLSTAAIQKAIDKVSAQGAEQCSCLPDSGFPVA